MNRYLFSAAFFLITFLIAGCIPRKERGELLKKVETLSVRMENEHTGLPDLLIKVPSGFVVEWTKEARYDKFYVYDPKDTGDIQKGMAVIDVTPYPARHIADSGKVSRSIGVIDSNDVVWKEYRVEEPGEPLLYQLETTSEEVFEEAGRFEEQKVMLHAFVVGSDSALVELLAASVETITVLPRKPNL